MTKILPSTTTLCIAGMLLLPFLAVMAEQPERVILDFDGLSGTLGGQDGWTDNETMTNLLPMEVSDGWVRVQGHGNAMIERPMQAEREFAIFQGDEEKAEFQFGIIYHPNLNQESDANISFSILGANSGITAGVGNGGIYVKNGGPWGSSPTLGTLDLPLLPGGTEITVRISMNFIEDKCTISWRNDSARDAFFQKMDDSEAFSLDGVGALASTWNRFSIRSNTGAVRIGRIIPNTAAAKDANLDL